MSLGTIQKCISSFAVFVVAAFFIFFYADTIFGESQSNDGPVSVNSDVFAFPAVTGTSTFKITSLPETNYEDTDFEGSGIFSAWEGTRGTGYYINLAHLGQVSETSDTFRLSFFDQAQCKGTEAGPLIEKDVNTHFTKPDLTTPLEDATHTTVRAYDAFTVKWGSGKLTVTIQRYWRKVALPEGKTPETMGPNDYNVERPLDSDVPGSAAETFVLSYEGRFAPPSTRITHGEPYDTDLYARPSLISVDQEKNLDFNFWDIVNDVEGLDEKPDEKVCNLGGEALIPKKERLCGCLNNENQLACGDPEVPFVDPWPPVQFSLATGADWQVNNIEDLRTAIAQFGEQGFTDAEVFLGQFVTNPEFGEKFSMSALARGYKSEINQLYYSWCIDGKSQQGVVAGGLPIEETIANDATLAADSKGCCNLVTRTPTVDENNDGIDDEWQRRYNLKAFGANDLLPADYDGDAAETDVVPNITGDGFIADQFLGMDVTPQGESFIINGFQRIALTPGSLSSKNESFVTGDGKFTAAEEYVWGTDPTEYDTDQDGYPDEADIVGVGQTNLDFRSDKRPREYPKDDEQFGNDRYNIQVRTVGKTNMLRDLTTAPEKETETFGLDLEDGIRVALDDVWAFAKDEDELSVTVKSEPQTPGLLDRVRVDAHITNGHQIEGKLFYSWYAKRIVGSRNTGLALPDGEDPILEGAELNFWDFNIQEVCPNCQPGDELVVSVEVSDTISGEVAIGKINIPIGTDNSLLQYQDCDQDGDDDAVGDPDYCFHSAQVTKDIPVRVEAGFINGNEEINNYYFQWSLDHVVQTSNCLLPGQTTTTTPRQCGFGTSQLVFTPKKQRFTHEIELTVYQKDPNQPENTFIPTASSEIIHLTAPVNVGIPAVTIVPDQKPNAGDGYLTGSIVRLRAIVEFLDPIPTKAFPDGQKGLKYTWKDEQHNTIKTEVLPSINESTVDITGLALGYADRTVEVISPDYVSPKNPDAPVVILGSTPIYFTDTLPTPPTALGAFVKRLASLRDALPEPVVRYGGGVAIFGIVLTAILGTVMYLRKHTGIV